MPLLMATSANPGTSYWLDSSTLGGLEEWTEDGTGNLTPDTTRAQDLGSPTYQIQTIYNNNSVLTDGSTFSAAIGVPGSIVIATSGATGGATAIPGGTVSTSPSNGGPGLLAMGGLISPSGTAKVLAQDTAVAFGLASSASDGAAEILGRDDGALAFGRTFATGAGSDAGVDSLSSSLAFGQVAAYSANIGQITAISSGLGFGYVGAEYGTARITANGAGAFANGSVRKYGGYITASGYGASAFGDVYNITGTYAITAAGYGALAFGFVYNDYNITASGHGAMAFGYPTSAAIVASGKGSAQFGSGTNSVAYSFQFGGGIRILTSGAGTNNGEIWVASNNVYIRSGGATRNCSNIP